MKCVRCQFVVVFEERVQIALTELLTQFIARASICSFTRRLHSCRFATHAVRRG